MSGVRHSAAQTLSHRQVSGMPYYPLRSRRWWKPRAGPSAQLSNRRSLSGAPSARDDAGRAAECRLQPGYRVDPGGVAHHCGVRGLSSQDDGVLWAGRKANREVHSGPGHIHRCDREDLSMTSTPRTATPDPAASSLMVMCA